MSRIALLLTLLLAAAGCSPSAVDDETASPADEASPESIVAAPRALDSPAGAGSFSPRLTAVGDEVGMTWLERVEGTPRRHRVRFARLAGGEWTAPATIVEAPDLFANWADYPGAVAAADGSLYAHWLAKTGEETYAYSIYVARSTDGGAGWEPLGRLNDDATQTEHGFVSWVREGDGARAVWLDGREMAAGGPMALRTAAVGAAGVGPSRVLDPRVCECCATAAARAKGTGVVVAYRDRDETEVRDISLVSGGAAGWSEPTTPVADGWRIAGCPVNGPGVAAADGRLALAWFSAADGTPVVRLALSADGGESFAAPLEIDAEAPLGRVDVAVAGGSAWVTWMTARDEIAEIRLVEVSGEVAGEPIVVATTSSSRASGFPSLLARPGRLIVAWTEIAEGTPSRVLLAEVPIDAEGIRVASR